MKAPSSITYLSAVVPCYNEEASLAETFSRLNRACHDCCPGRYEIIFVDDGSTDGTWQLICQLGDLYSEVVGVKLSRNHGHQLALTAGLSVATGDRIFIIDADLQDPPELLKPMMERINDGVEVVYGRRIERKGESAFKKITAHYFYRILNSLVDIEIPADTGDFRLMTRKANDMLSAMPERHRFIRGMVAWIGLRQEPFDYVRDERFAGETKYPLRKMLALAIDAITGFSTRPLRLASYLGLFFAAVSILLFIYALSSWLFFNTIAGWMSLISTVLLLGSAQLVVLGVIGEYLGRLFVEVKGRPAFIIDKIYQMNPTNRTSFNAEELESA